ncbi:MAG: class I SAM-dependent methyltransferase [Mycobacterium sp.]
MRDACDAPIVAIIMNTGTPHTAPVTISQPATTSTPWAKVLARIYDPFLYLGELCGMRRQRKEVLKQATGRILEVGAGTGLNLAHYPDDIDELLLTEPDPAMRARLQRRVGRAGRQATVIGAPAGLLPVADESIDTVVCTLVLCTVPAPDAALREIARVLAPRGQLLFIEHVRAESAPLAYLQDRLAAPWRGFAGGCRCNRATGQLMQACGFELDAVEATWHAMPMIVRPLIAGRATQPTN